MQFFIFNTWTKGCTDQRSTAYLIKNDWSKMVWRKLASPKQDLTIAGITRWKRSNN